MADGAGAGAGAASGAGAGLAWMTGSACVMTGSAATGAVLITVPWEAPPLAQELQPVASGAAEPQELQPVASGAAEPQELQPVEAGAEQVLQADPPHFLWKHEPRFSFGSDSFLEQELQELHVDAGAEHELQVGAGAEHELQVGAGAAQELHVGAGAEQESHAGAAEAQDLQPRLKVGSLIFGSDRCFAQGSHELHEPQELQPWLSFGSRSFGRLKQIFLPQDGAASQPQAGAAAAQPQSCAAAGLARPHATRAAAAMDSRCFISLSLLLRYGQWRPEWAAHQGCLLLCCGSDLASRPGEQHRKALIDSSPKALQAHRLGFSFPHEPAAAHPFRREISAPTRVFRGATAFLAPFSRIG